MNKELLFETSPGPFPKVVSKMGGLETITAIT